MKNLILLIALFVMGCSDTSYRNSETNTLAPETEVTAPTPPLVLLYTPYGTWDADINSIPRRLTALGVNFVVVKSLKGINYSDYKAIIVPGGWAPTMAKYATSYERSRLVSAVNNGLNYLGICAGAFLAGRGYNYYGFRFINYAFDYPSFFYKGRQREANSMTTVFGNRKVVYSWGPDLSPVSGTVLGRYDNNATSIVTKMYGKGKLVLSAGHPELYEEWKKAIGVTNDTDGDDEIIFDALVNEVIQ